jgi:hypothetical protein
MPPFEELTKLIYGEAGVGKTSFCDGHENAFFLATEPGHDFVKSPVRYVCGWSADPRGKDEQGRCRRCLRGNNQCSDFQSMVRAIWKARQSNKWHYKVVIIDIVDNLYAQCLNAVCAAKGIEYPPENDYGKTWKEVRDEWEKWLRILLDQTSVVFVTHCTTDKVDVQAANGVRKEIERRVPTFRGNKPAQFLDGIVNLVGFAHFGATGERQIIFKGDQATTTKDRTSIFEGQPPLPLRWAVIDEFYRKGCEAKGIKIKSKWQ